MCFFFSIGFQPSNLCTLRTVKADLICGLGKDVVAELYKKNEKWNYTGEYGVVQFSKKP
jgi:damage-control phosphatase, subfamily III